MVNMSEAMPTNYLPSATVGISNANITSSTPSGKRLREYCTFRVEKMKGIGSGAPQQAMKRGNKGRNGRVQWVLGGLVWAPSYDRLSSEDDNEESWLLRPDSSYSTRSSHSSSRKESSDNAQVRL